MDKKRFKRGDRVRVIARDSFVEHVGRIEKSGKKDGWAWWVRLEGVEGRMGFNEDELATEPRAEVAGNAAVADGGATGYERYVAEQEYWKRIETDYRETVGRLHGIVEKHNLPAPPGEEVDKTIEREFAALQARNTALEAELARVRAALEPFAETWLQVPFGLRSTLRIWNGLIGDEDAVISLGISTDDLEAAHTAFFNLADSK